jgi:hypothetical protein
MKPGHIEKYCPLFNKMPQKFLGTYIGQNLLGHV